MHKIRFNLYPNNEVRLTHYYKAEAKAVNPTDLNSVEAAAFSGTASNPDGECEKTSCPSLDISAKVSQRENGMPHRKTKFGLAAKRTLLRLGGAYDTVDTVPEHYVFLTGTIPGGTHDCFLAMAQESRYAVQSIAQWLKRTCETPHWFYVWELQERGALHIHYCVYAPDTSSRNKILLQWWAKWHSIIQEVGERRHTDMWLRKDGSHHREGHKVLQAYAQEVRKSVAAYLAGYCGGSKDKHKADATSPYYPGRWWGCSRESTRLLKSLTLEEVVDYSNYRGARADMVKNYETIRHATPLAHHYPHKIGVGSTITSYHPEDRGKEIWQQLTMKTHPPTKFPSCSSWILQVEKYIQTWMLYSRPYLKRKGIPSEKLLQDLEGILSQGSLSKYTLHQSTVKAVLHMNSLCSLNTLLLSNRELITKECVPPIWMLFQVQHQLKWNRQGWLNLENDLAVRLTDCWASGTISTNDPEGLDAVLGAAHGSLSPRNPLPTQLELWHS